MSEDGDEHRAKHERLCRLIGAEDRSEFRMSDLVTTLNVLLDRIEALERVAVLAASNKPLRISLGERGEIILHEGEE